jgi:ferric-dicitrate binding protein FerR (iron transport regulator)
MSHHWIDKYNQNQSDKPSQPDQDDFDLFMKLSEYDAEIDTEAAWNRLSKKVNRQKQTMNWLVRIAAILILGMSVTFIVINQSDVDKGLVEKTVISSQSVTKAYLLPDGSQVTLAPQSQITFNSEDFSSNRNIGLKGEAFFDITKSSNPFVIESPQGEVRVLGTSFNLNVNKNLDLFVKSGIVVVKTKHETIKVTKGHRALASKTGKLTIVKYNGTNLLSWSTGYFRFENEPLESVIPYLEKYYDVEFHTSKSLKNCKVTAEFDRISLKQVVDAISTILNAKGEINNKKVKISGSGCD